MARFLKSAALNLLLVLVSLGIAFSIAEFAFRSINPDGVFMLPRYVTGARYNEYSIRTNVPGVDYTHRTADGHWRYKINARGQRDEKEYAYDKPAGVLRVLVLGDSFTLGFEVGQDQSYAAVLARNLARRGVKAEVINAGVSGFSNAEALIYLREEGLRYDPDVVILGFFVNDLMDNVRADLFRLDGTRPMEKNKAYLPVIGPRDFLNSFWIYRWLSEHSYIHNYLNAKATVFVRDYLAAKNLAAADRTDDPQVTAAGYPGALARALIAEIHRTANAAGARFILMDIPSPTLESALPIAPREVGDFADQFLDMRRILTEYAGLIDLYRPHGFEHWTEFSHLLAGLALTDLVIAQHAEPRPLIPMPAQKP